jgi:hypothetical protein
MTARRTSTPKKAASNPVAKTDTPPGKPKLPPYKLPASVGADAAGSASVRAKSRFRRLSPPGMIAVGCGSKVDEMRGVLRSCDL